MRRLALILLFAFAVHGQTEARRPVRLLPLRPASLDPYLKQVRVLIGAIQRDSYIVAMLVHATSDLDGFQKMAAVEKARDRVQSAQHRAVSGDPPAPAGTIDILNGLLQTLDHAREQGTMADTEALKTELLRRTHFIQRDLFWELDTARSEHGAIVDMQGKLFELGTELESSMVDALGTTFDFVRAGGQ
jgi:hypothetical protein